MKFSMNQIQELIRHLKCISRKNFDTIDFGCSSDHMWNKLKDKRPDGFLMDLDLGNLDALGVYFDQYLKRNEK